MEEIKQGFAQQEGMMVKMERKKSNAEVCDICFEPYHILGRWPMIACPNEHCVCDHCLDDMFAYSGGEPCPCPICRALIRRLNIKPHHKLFAAINHESNREPTPELQMRELFMFAFQHEIFEIAEAFKKKKETQILSLPSLDASQRKIQNYEQLLVFGKLRRLNLERNLIEDVSLMGMLTSLKILNVSSNKISDVSALGELKNLQILALENNLISSIPNLLDFEHLRHWFLLGNPLEAIIAEQFPLVPFKNLITLSVSFGQHVSKQVVRDLAVRLCEDIGCLPALQRLFLQELSQQDNLSEDAKDEMTTKLARRNVRTEWVELQSNIISPHEEWLEKWIQDYYVFGETFHFQPDKSNPHMRDYAIKEGRIVKMSSQFTIINSSSSIRKGSRISLKLKLNTNTQHIVIGLCNAFLKHNPNVYSEHFVGLTLWGAVYSRSEYSPLIGKIRLQDLPVMRMSVDFVSQRIEWFSDGHLVASVILPSQFKHSQLYFLIGMRDMDTSITFLDE